MTAAAPEMHVEIDSVCLSFGRREVMRNLSCGFPRGRVSVLMGGSGTGKSTLLRLIGGLLRPDSGSVRVAGTDVTRLGERSLGQVRTQLGMLFQNGALLDSISIFDNLALPMRERTREDETEIARRVHARLEAVGLADVDDLLPGELSGGMLKRAALARATIMNPEILLCDEPFSGLDPPNVLRIEALLTRLSQELGLTVIMTSHHVATSRRMSAQVVLLLDGASVSGTPVELATHADPRVAEFLGVSVGGRGDADGQDALPGVDLS
jgi:phospholipid/cholesterol/gamma-HCH transport system ATP-binding protein